MIKNVKLRILLFTLVLFSLTLIILSLNGRTYVYKTNVKTDNIDNLIIEIDQDKEIVKIIDKKIVNNNLYITLESVSKGKAYLQIKEEDTTSLEIFYVHTFGIISKNTFLGRMSNDLVIPISIVIYIGFLLYYLIKKYLRSKKEDIYQYKNITYLGIIIFLSAMFIQQLLQLISYNGMLYSIRSFIYSLSFLSFILFPVAIIVSIFVIISNVILLKREGFTWKNMLGIILGILIILLTIIPEYAYLYFQNTSLIDIHNESGIALYIYDFVETSIYLGLAYLECILLATIILGIKTAKNIPEYNKDFIIILGCMIKKDGSLTPLLKARVDRAIEFSKMQKEKTNKDIIFVPSGGKGNDEPIPESVAMKNYLLEQGINNKNILLEDKSTNTYQNIKYSSKLIKEKNDNPNIAFSTTNYHVFRAGLIASEQGIKMEGIGARAKAYFWINAFIREFIATLYSEKKKHIKILLAIIIIIIFIIYLTYITNIK